MPPPHDDTAAARAERRPAPLVSVIVPTYQEIDSLPELLRRLQAVHDQLDGQLEVLIVDDQSQDGSEQYVASLGLEWVQLITRATERGLSSAVVHGFRSARGKYLVCMDADLSHPPEKIPDLVAALESRASFVIGSRYAVGGSTDQAWSCFRRLNSWVATLMARPFTDARDPMSGFFALRKTDFDSATELNPIGYKIGLELIVKCHCDRVAEIPIHFADRKSGKSKLTLAEQLRYAQHVRRLFGYAFPRLSHFVQLAAVGACTVVVNLAVLTGLLGIGLRLPAAYAPAVVVALSTDFALSRGLGLCHARHRPGRDELAGFVSARGLGALVNYGATVGLVTLVPAVAPQLAALAGIALGVGSNFLRSRCVVLR
jgi:dolichol-phosphate mannosyltransferase